MNKGNPLATHPAHAGKVKTTKTNDMKFKEFKEKTIGKCHKAGACEGQFERLLRADKYGEDAAFIRVLMDNNGWCIGRKIYTAKTLLEIEEQDILLDAGLKTQKNEPIDFQPEKIFGVTWKPYNEGSNGRTWKGDYLTHYEVCEKSFRRPDRIIPSDKDFRNLCILPNIWSIYQGQFGMLFGGRVFIPAGGMLHKGEKKAAAVGNSGFSWSSSVSGIYGLDLSFHSASLNPSHADSRARGFQVRCLQE